LKQSKLKSTTIETVKAHIDLLGKAASDIQKKVEELVQPISTSISVIVTDSAPST